MIKEKNINKQPAMRWINKDIIHVSPVIYRKRLNSLINGITKLKIKQNTVRDNQLLEELESKQVAMLQLFSNIDTLLGEIYVSDFAFRIKQKVKKQRQRRDRRKIVKKVKITSNDTFDQTLESYRESSVLENTLFKDVDIINLNLNVTIEDLDISIFDTLV
jgi:patatin-like phospholipase/acyl hydrolase